MMDTDAVLKGSDEKEDYERYPQDENNAYLTWEMKLLGHWRENAWQSCADVEKKLIRLAMKN